MFRSVGIERTLGLIRYALNIEPLAGRTSRRQKGFAGCERRERVLTRKGSDLCGKFEGGHGRQSQAQLLRQAVT